MSDAVSLLMRSASPYGLAHELVDAERWPLDTDAIVRTKDANAVDEALLPLLAWERSVDVWNPKWPLAKRRAVTAQAYELTRLKGTREGLRRYVELADGKVRQIEAPPLLAFPGRDWTDDERLAWLARFPQVRTYKYGRTGNSALAAFLTERRPTCLVEAETTTDGRPAGFLTMETIDGEEYLGHESYLWQNGEETPLTRYTREVVDVDKTVAQFDLITIPGSLGGALFLDHDPGLPAQDGEIGYFPTSLDPVAARTVSVATDPATYTNHAEKFSARTISPGLDPIYLKPERVAEIAEARTSTFFLDHPKAVPTASADDPAALHIYDRLYLHETGLGAVPMPPEARCFLDHAYFQFPAYTARVSVEITGTLPASAVTRFVRGYLVDPDLSGLWELVDAVRASKSARDLIQIDTQSYDVVTTSGRLVCGSATCGSQTRS